MCLYTEEERPVTATEDIVCYKVTRREKNEEMMSLYIRSPVKMNQVLTVLYIKGMLLIPLNMSNWWNEITMKREIIYLTPEEQSALHKIPEDADYTRYVCWCGLLALRGLRLPIDFHHLPFMVCLREERLWPPFFFTHY